MFPFSSVRSLSIVLCIGFAACVTPVQSEIDSPATDFSAFKTFNWIDPAESPYAPAFARNPLVDKRIRLTVEDQLIGKGYRKAEPGAADFLVTYHVAAADQIEFSPSGARSVQTQAYIQAVLRLDVYEAQSKQLAWHGLTTKPFDSRDAAVESIRELVGTIVEKFVADTSQ
jgi:hypothetical protein